MDSQKIKYDEVICPECNGEKYIQIKTNKSFTSKKRCYKCNGQGKLNWIDNITDKNRLKIDNYDLYFRSGKDSVLSQELIL